MWLESIPKKQEWKLLITACFDCLGTASELLVTCLKGGLLRKAA